MRRTLADARCLVTGASSGLGRALAEHLSAEGARLLLTGRSAERLESLARTLVDRGARPDSVATLAADLTDPADRRRLFEAAKDQFRALDLVVNCAGVGAYGHFETHDETILRRVFEINVFALAEVARASLPMLRLGRDPVLVNVGSVVGRRALPGRPEYSASKFAVTGFTESLRAEWVKFGIHIMLINPGFTATEFERNLIANTAIYPTDTHRSMTVDQVARATLRALRRNTNELNLSLQGRLLLLVNRISPRFVDWGLARFVRKLFPDAATAPVPQSVAHPADHG